jgi:pyrimidine deaminase RibD-like protein
MATTRKLDPRKMMEQAIAVMKESINEPRADKKASPLVGAVLVKPDGTVDTAFRGELRHGDHAEYTLLERKHNNERLDGSFLFATLEPCAPGARKNPKLACAERIVNARIAEVWVGIEDPDPMVDRQGIRYLEQNGPREILHHAGLNATIEYPDGTHEIQNFDGPAILIPDLVEKWLRPKLPNVIDRSRMTRVERPALPFDLVREAVINALVHRDYDLTGATCHLVVTADTVTVRSPGAPLLPITVERMQAFTAPMYNRNPKLQFAFGGTKLVEGRGFGMRTFGEAAAKHGLPVPKYAFDGVYLNLTIYRHAGAAMQALELSVLEQLSKSERSGWVWLATKQAVTSNEYAEALKVPYRTAMNHLAKFQQLGLLEKVGSARTTEYKVRRR